ncbi:uncharacterized protein MONOS_5787 [Monocercomonoides exilis]|uniref:uncharacterized protein n=1 Tax=Monocercomonoides exilis TaxID=2049356 RepID=UPI00355A1839|nr:hypothetical protein MONOS_5787 [Monocercomonoides exilis]|eukprot:MONOS_5787.1-p1 / transcript=MONOS_5787.1 / gene=MONOS_5787 / organism=Monocercomonoides_exilis_PA203 / gene_product=unspecified product / transcript_product=unspecified product / location=Mono_scaffold00173:48741-51248(-) / protein_length=836 / sequence_SO=supercontig / SO=protein_coding / is_pseudo=false
MERYATQKEKDFFRQGAINLPNTKTFLDKSKQSYTFPEQSACVLETGSECAKHDYKATSKIQRRRKVSKKEKDEKIQSLIHELSNVKLTKTREYCNIKREALSSLNKSFEQDVQEHVKKVIDPQMMNYAEIVRRKISCLLKNHFPGFFHSVQLFGSTRSSITTLTSDIDLVAIPKNGYEKLSASGKRLFSQDTPYKQSNPKYEFNFDHSSKFSDETRDDLIELSDDDSSCESLYEYFTRKEVEVRDIAKYLERCGCSILNLIPHARVPIVKFRVYLDSMEINELAMESLSLDSKPSKHNPVALSHSSSKQFDLTSSLSSSSSSSSFSKSSAFHYVPNKSKTQGESSSTLYKEFDCDLNIGKALGIFNSTLLRTYCLLDERVLQLSVLVKEWANKRSISETFKGYLSSFGWTLLVLTFLMECSPPVIVSLQDKAYLYESGWREPEKTDDVSSKKTEKRKSAGSRRQMQYENVVESDVDGEHVLFSTDVNVWLDLERRKRVIDSIRERTRKTEGVQISRKERWPFLHDLEEKKDGSDVRRHIGFDCEKTEYYEGSFKDEDFTEEEESEQGTEDDDIFWDSFSKYCGESYSHTDSSSLHSSTSSRFCNKKISSPMQSSSRSTFSSSSSTSSPSFSSFSSYSSYSSSSPSPSLSLSSSSLSTAPFSTLASSLKTSASTSSARANSYESYINTQPLSELFYQFFYFYTHVFQPSKHVANIRAGCVHLNSESRSSFMYGRSQENRKVVFHEKNTRDEMLISNVPNWTDEISTPDPLRYNIPFFIQDPLETYRNVGDTIRRTSEIMHLMEDTYNRLKCGLPFKRLLEEFDKRPRRRRNRKQL